MTRPRRRRWRRLRPTLRRSKLRLRSSLPKARACAPRSRTWREIEVAANQKALEKVTAIKEKQFAEFNAKEKDQLDSTSALKAAITLLFKHHGASLFQTHMLGVAATLQHGMQNHAQLRKAGGHTQRGRPPAPSSVRPRTILVRPRPASSLTHLSRASSLAPSSGQRGPLT